MQGLFARVRSIVRGIRRHEQLDGDMDDEFRAHVEMRAADLERSGLSRQDAWRQARLEFGSAEAYKDVGRAARGLRSFDTLMISWLDVKLGVRMLVKYPGLTIVGGLAIAFAIVVGAGTFEFVRQLLAPALPLPGGDRIVAIAKYSLTTGNSARNTTQDLLAWKSLRSLEHVGAHRSYQRNLSLAGAIGEQVMVGEMSSAAFPLTRATPLLGRVLVEADEVPGAPDVVVIGYDVWQQRLGGDRDVIGKQANVGGVARTVVGVMPEDFKFPTFHEVWIPLRVTPAMADPQTAQWVGDVFGRLREGYAIADLQAELAALYPRLASDFPDTYRNVRPTAIPFSATFMRFDGLQKAGLWSSNVLVGMLLVLVCGNVALLMFARAATRQNEIVVRSALGASRRRIVMQLFAEALVLAVVAAAVGLVVTDIAIDGVWAAVTAEAGGRLPFWFRPDVSPLSVAYAGLLALIAAIIAGVIPALKVTAGGMDARLRQHASSGLKFGGMWTVIIVLQIAVTMGFPIALWGVRGDASKIRTAVHGFDSQQFLTTRVQLDLDPLYNTRSDTGRDAIRARFEANYRALEQRLLAEPAVRGVTYGDRMPLQYHPHLIAELDAGPAGPLNPHWPEGYRVSQASVDPRFFEVLGVPIVAGRGFTPADAAEGQRAVIVNEKFVQLVMGGASPIGRRLRYIRREGQPLVEERGSLPWYEIVGVARNAGVDKQHDPKVARIYHTTSVGLVSPPQLAIHLSGAPQAFGPRLRELALAVDPALRLSPPMAMPRVLDSELQFLDMWTNVLLAVSLVAMGLSLAGIYSVMAFTVAKRRREIGVRVALGATRLHVVMGVFKRPATQIALGIGAGTMLTMALTNAVGSNASLRGIALVAAYTLAMTAICMLACVVPTLRALRVEPTEALKEHA